MIYLDYSANTPADEAVLQCFCDIERRFTGNPNSLHPAGGEAKEKLAHITASIATLLHITENEIIYTSGASEANNTAIKGIAHASRHIGRHIISTPLEHASVSGCLTSLQEQGYEIDILRIGRDGKIDLKNLHDLLRKDTILVSVCAVDSELGTIQPIQETVEILKNFPNCRLHVDATQAIGKIDFFFDGIDTASFAPHKFYGLNGSGILFKRKDCIITPLIHGGTSTTVYRSGTPTLALDASAEASLRLALENMDKRNTVIRKRNEMLRAALSKYPKVRINSPEDAVPHILNLSVEGVKGIVFQNLLSEKGVCVSVKSACSTDGTPSRAVFAVSHNRKNALSSWRISLSHLTTEEEIGQFMNIFECCYGELTK